MTPLIVGLIGRKRSGKDTLCRIIQSRYPNAERVAIADPLKEDIARRFETSVQAIEENKEFWRPVLQWWGLTHREMWTAKAFLRIENSPSNLVVVTDARYPEQFDLIRRRNGLLVRVLRDEQGSADMHPSEDNVTTAGADLFVWNPGDVTFADGLGELWREIDKRLV